MKAITVVYPPSLRIESRRACLRQIKRRPRIPNETLWRPINRHRVESLDRVYTQSMRMNRALNFTQAATALLHAQRTNLPENSRLELWSKPGQRRKETLSIGATVRKRRLMSPQQPFDA